MTGGCNGGKGNDILNDEKWIEKHQLSYIDKDYASCKGPLYDTCRCTHDVLIAVKYRLQKLGMSDRPTHSEPSVISRRPPVPCPRLPKSFEVKQTKTGNYSYAEVEFRPMLVTEEGAISAPIRDTPCDNSTQDDLIASSTDNLQWDEDLGLYDSEKPYNQGYAENIRDFEIPQEVTSSLRETAIVDENNEPEGNFQSFGEDYSSEYIYDTPIDTSSQREIDVSQLYAQVDFSAKKKKSPNNDSSAINGIAKHKEPISKKSSYDEITKFANSKFFIDTPDKRSRTPPPIPAPYRSKLVLFNFLFTLLISFV